jgi:hypothetical protein
MQYVVNNKCVRNHAFHKRILRIDVAQREVEVWPQIAQSPRNGTIDSLPAALRPDA